MKKMRKIIPAFAMLMVAAIMMSTASFAWFSMGTTATATGMEIEASADSSMIISLDKELADFMSATSTVSLASQNPSNAIAPATHDNDYATYADGLKYIDNADDTGAVDAGTGMSSSTATWDAATKGTHFVEYVVYIGSAGGDISAPLKAELDIDAVTKNIHNALTVDFWVATTTGGVPGALEFKGRINVDDTVDGTATPVTLATSVPQTVKDSTLGEFLMVVMRVYFDGALTDDAEPGSTYVRNTMITETAVELGLKFYAN